MRRQIWEGMRDECKCSQPCIAASLGQWGGLQMALNLVSVACLNLWRETKHCAAHGIPLRLLQADFSSYHWCPLSLY